jgi:hypothetical protein
MATLEEVLTDNGFAKFAGIFAKEMITLNNASKLTDGDLKEFGLPWGARKDLLELFGEKKPQRPDAPPSSRQASPNKHSGRTLQGGGDCAMVEWTKHGSGKTFACFLSHHKASCAMEARFLKKELQGLIAKECFLDSDNLRVSSSTAAGAGAGWRATLLLLLLRLRLRLRLLLLLLRLRLRLRLLLVVMIMVR